MCEIKSTVQYGLCGLFSTVSLVTRHQTDMSHSLCLWQIIVLNLLPSQYLPLSLSLLLLLLLLLHRLSVSVTHTSFCPAYQSPTKFPGSHYIWQYFILDLRISERISVQARSLAWKRRSVWKAKGLHDVGSPPPHSHSHHHPALTLIPTFFFPPMSLFLSLSPSLFAAFCWFSCEWLPDTTLANSSRS